VRDIEMSQVGVRGRSRCRLVGVRRVDDVSVHGSPNAMRRIGACVR
jgi:hypothetical protein